MGIDQYCDHRHGAILNKTYYSIAVPILIIVVGTTFLINVGVVGQQIAATNEQHCNHQHPKVDEVSLSV